MAPPPPGLDPERASARDGAHSRADGPGFRVGFFVAFLVVGTVVFYVGGYLAAGSPVTRGAVKLAIPLVLLAAMLVARRAPRAERYVELCFALLLASLGWLVAYALSGPALRAAGVSTDSINGLALTKLTESAAVLLPILAGTRIAFGDLGWLYVRRGRLGRGLLVGGAFFVVFAGVFLLQARERGIEAATLIAWLPWIGVFIFANALVEEIHYRGLLLGRLEPFLGPHGSNLAIAIVFTAVHAPVRYTPDIAVFLVVLLVLALAWGFLIQKTESIWGSVVFHAGADTVILLGILDTYR